MSDPVTVTRDSYDRVAGAYAQRNAEPFARLVADMDWLASQLPAGAEVLDAGCGPGRDVHLLRERGLRVVGMDLSLGMLRADGVGGLAQADMRALPLVTAGVHGVWCQAALLHVPRVDVPAVLAEFARVLRPGGLLHLAVSEGDGEGYEHFRYADEARWFVHHREQPLTGLLDAAGFSVLDTSRNHAVRDWLRLRARRG